MDSLDLITDTFLVNSSNIGPFDRHNYSPQETTSYVRSLYQVSLNYRLLHSIRRNSDRICLIWGITLNYDFRSSGHIVMKLKNMIMGECSPAPNLWHRLGNIVAFLSIIILIFSLWGLFLNIRSICRNYQLLRKLQRRLQRQSQVEASRHGRLETMPNFISQPLLESDRDFVEQSQTDENNQTTSLPSQTHNQSVNSEIPYMDSDLTVWDKLRFFNSWTILSMFSSILNVVNSVSGLWGNRLHIPLSYTGKLIQGLGCATLWILLISSFAHNSNYYIIALTLQRAIPHVMRFLVGVLPVLLSYSFFGMLYFGEQSSRFGDFSHSMITLFSLLNGDIMRETFMDLYKSSPVIGQIYLYSFVCLFIYVVLNVFVAIVEESFIATRARAKGLESLTRRLRQEERESSERKYYGEQGDANEKNILVESNLPLNVSSHNIESTGAGGPGCKRTKYDQSALQGEHELHTSDRASSNMFKYCDPNLNDNFKDSSILRTSHSTNSELTQEQLEFKRFIEVLNELEK